MNDSAERKDRKLFGFNILNIRMRRLLGEQVKVLADEYNVSPVLISRHTRDISPRKVRSDKKC